MARMWTIVAICAGLALAACTRSAGDPDAKAQSAEPPPAASGTRVAGFSGILARSAILFERPDKSLTQCFFAEGRLSHCSSIPDPDATVVGYTALGSLRTLRDGEDSALLLQRADGSLRQCLFVEGAMSSCSDAPDVQGRIVGYNYFSDASAILAEETGGALTHCFMEGSRLSNCFTHVTAPGRILGMTEAGEAEATILLAREDGALAECLLSVDGVSDCSTVAAPFDAVAGYHWGHPSASILFARENGSLVQCSLTSGVVSECADVPPPP